MTSSTPFPASEDTFTRYGVVPNLGTGLKPVVAIQLIKDAKTYTITALLDSGADHPQIPLFFAQRMLGLTDSDIQKEGISHL